jgi:predicted RNase H-like HicB family nuclease
MKSILQFVISQEDGGYVAEGVDIALVTQADTLDELAKNIREAVELHFEGEDPEAFGFVREPSVLMNVDLSRTFQHA